MDKFTKTKNWSYTEQDEKAESVFTKIQQQSRRQMPSTIYSRSLMTHYQQVQRTNLFSILKNVPKAVLHHCHIDCNEDKQFYRLFVINDPIIYLNSEKKQFKLGTKKQAEQDKWVSMEELRKNYTSDDQMIDFLSNITMFNKQNHKMLGANQVTFWKIFEDRVVDFFPILYSIKHFKLYLRYICEKYLKNGYDRLEFRSMIVELNEYDNEGNLIQTHPEKKFTELIDEVCQQLYPMYPDFSLGVIFFGLRMFSPEQNEKIFTGICELNWDKTLGFDLVQQQDPYGSAQPYDQVVSKVLAKYPHLDIKKVYHVGQTRNHNNNNVQIAVKAGSVRIGHGINIIQRLQFLQECKNVCFEISPISNILAGYRDDMRIGTAPILMSLGHALTINPDDPGKFGYEDSTADYFWAMISYNWGLKELKLLSIHSINHAICSEEQKSKLISSFNSKWNNWIEDLLTTRQ